MPDLSDLDHFDQGLPTMHALPPAEIRRRGDRRRRRRTTGAAVAGVLVVAIAVGAPIAALSGDGGDEGQPFVADPSPTPTWATTAEPAAGWVTTIPDDFPLTAGFADEDAEPSDLLANDPAVPAGCDQLFIKYEDNLVVAHHGNEDGALRILAVYPDALSAQAWLSQWRAGVYECGPEPVGEGTTLVYRVVNNVDLGTEEAYAFVERVQHDDGLFSDLSLTVIGRTGNAIYADHSYGAAGGDPQVEAEIARLVESAGEPVEALCVFAVDGCEG